MRFRARNDNGTLGETIFYISATPLDEQQKNDIKSRFSLETTEPQPMSGKPTLEKPTLEKPTQYNTNIYNTKKYNNIYGQNFSNEKILTEYDQMSFDIKTGKKDTDLPTIPSKSNDEEIRKDFEKLWKLYPRKFGKQKAFDSYKKALKDNSTNFKKVEDGINAYNKYLKESKVNVKYIKHGSTWFNQRCWEDEYIIEQSTTKSEEDKLCEEMANNENW